MQVFKDTPKEKHGGQLPVNHFQTYAGQAKIE